MRAKIKIRDDGKIGSPDQHATWYIRMQGNCTEIFRKLNYTTIPSEDKRGLVGGFSRESRMSLLRLVNKIDAEKIGKSSFVTLTYPDRWLYIGKVLRSTHRAQFLKKFEYHCGNQYSTLWRVEWKPRLSGYNVGVLAPHYHYMVFNCPWVNKESLRRWWAEILDEELYVDVDIKKIKDWTMASTYISKYVAKPSTLGISAYRNNPYMQGRHWGNTRKELLPMADVDCCQEMTDQQAKLARKYAAEQLRNYDTERGGGFTLFGQQHRIAFLTMNELGS